MQISLIIPSRNEAAIIAQQIERLRALGADSEVILCDGDSTDATVRLAREAGAKVLLGEANRGTQQNAGAQAARGEILWFLHADAQPHPASLQFLQRVAPSPRVIGGNFRLQFDSGGWVPRAFETIARAQRKRGIYYGDSGIWVRREVFDLLGGFAPWPLFEDYDFARRLEAFAKRHRKSTFCSPLPIVTSSRRFQEKPARVLLQWTWLQMQFQLGISPEVLAQKYFRHEP